MDLDDTWAEPTEKLENKGGEKLFLTPHQVIHPSIPKSLPSLKKIQLLPLSNELATSSLLGLEFVSTRPPATNIKPPPPIFTDLWGDSDSSSEPDASPQTNISNLNQIVEETQDTYISEDTLFVSEEKSKLNDMGNELWEDEPLISEEASEDWAEYDLNAFDDTNIFEDLDLFDIDAALDKQETDIQLQEREVSIRRSRFERWGGISSLIYVNWDNAAIAEQDALERLGYANIELSKETRAFIIQAARNARLPHKQEVHLTTQLVNARAQLALLPSYNEEETIDPYATRRRTLLAEIAEIEQTLTCKMQWVAIKKAVQYLGQGIEIDDLIQIGMLGVIAGIQHFDITRKARLLIAVNSWTFQALARATADYGSAIRLPVYMFDQIKTLKKKHLQWQLAHGYLPTRLELAEVMDISTQDLEITLKFLRILRLSKEALSIEHSINAEYLNEGYSFQAPEIDFSIDDDISTDILGEIDGQQTSYELFQYLTPREQQVFSLRTGLDEDGNFHTLEEIGQLLGVTRERIRQIEERARKKLTLQLQQMSPASSEPQKAKENAAVIPDDDKSEHQKTGKVKGITPYTKTAKKRHLKEKKVEDAKQSQGEERIREAAFFARNIATN